MDREPFRGLLLDVRSSDAILNDSLQLLTDDLPGSARDEAAKKLRRGMYLSSFNSLETFIKAVTNSAAEQISDLSLPLSSLSESVRKSIYNGMATALAKTPNWLNDKERTVRSWRFSSAICDYYERGVVSIIGDQFFSGSNVQYREVKNIANFFSDIYFDYVSVEIGKEYPKCQFDMFMTKFFDLCDDGFNRYVKSTCSLPPSAKQKRRSKSGGPGRLELQKDSRLPVEKCYSEVARIRNTSAHSSNHIPSVRDIRFLNRVQVLVGCGFFCYMEAIVSGVDKARSGDVISCNDVPNLMQISMPSELNIPAVLVKSNLAPKR